MGENKKDNFVKEIKYMIPMIAIALVIVAFDQWTKAMIRAKLATIGVSEVIKGFFEFSYSENTGAAFGSFQGKNAIFIIVGIIAIGFIFYIFKSLNRSTWMRISFGLILGGALGNLIDRIAFGFVIDFIRIRVTPSIWWPNFNIADAGITVGAIMFAVYKLIDSYRISKSEEE
ncbi:MAG: signal peptidase II [Candidatus Poribacteria bacterium]